MKVYKNGICREIDDCRKQEFIEKGYMIEGEIATDIVEVLQQQNEALKAEVEKLKTQIATDIVEVLQQQNEAPKAEVEKLKTQIATDIVEVLQQQNEAPKAEVEKLKTQIGGDENAPTDGTEENGETTEAKTTTRARK